MSEEENKSESNYLLLKNLEEKIRQFIEQELSEFTSQWWKQRIPGDVKENAEERKQKDERRKNWDYKKQPLISYIDFTDYEKIITQKNNWKDVFQYVFHDKIAISGKLKEVDPIRNAISHTRNLDSYEVKQIKFYSEEILRAITYYLKNKSQIISEKIEFVEPVLPIPISVSFDKTVYPINSTVYLRANVPQLIPNEALIFQIFNNKNKMIFERRISYNDIPSKELTPGAGIYQTSFTMNEDWKVGEKYILKGKHGASKILSQSQVDAHEPVVQSDKSVYIIGSDMIVTVIDPDADKDNQVAEYVGDREDSKLIIESPYGKIEGYRLRETGDSTGIFQGIIGILGIRKDGSVIPQTVDGKVIDKIQGTELDDGYIGGSPGDELTVSYKNNTGTAQHTFFISNFGGVIELDQKVYAPTDKVYITIVAPDLNLNSNIIDEIGVNPENIIQIRTSKDKIDKYKLVETNNDTGIFTGEIQLIKKLDSSNLKSNNDGPVNGKLLCDDDDFIEVSLNLFQNETVIGRAMIKSIENENSKS